MIRRMFLSTVSAIIVLSLVLVSQVLGDSDSDLQQAENLLAEGQYEQAKSAFEQVIADYPGGDYEFVARWKLTLAHIATYSRQEAAACVEQLSADFADHAHLGGVLCDIADHRKAKESYASAAELYEKVMRDHPDSPHAILAQKSLAVCYLRLERDEAAQAAINKLRSDFSSDDRLDGAMWEIANNCRILRRHAQAIELYSSVAKDTSEQLYVMESLHGLAMSYLATGRDGLAEDTINTMLGDHGKCEGIAEACCDIAGKYCRMSRYDKAGGLYEYVISNHPNSPAADWARVGQRELIIHSLIDAGQDTEALGAADVMIRDFAGNAYLASAVYGVGEQYYVKGFKLPADANGQQRTYYLQKAVDVFERVISNFSGSQAAAESYTAAGDCYSSLGRYAEAGQCYQAVVDGYPGYRLGWHCLFMAGRCYEQMARTGAVSSSEAAGEIKSRYLELLRRYPTCKAAGHARHWLSQQIRKQ